MYEQNSGRHTEFESCHHRCVPHRLNLSGKCCNLLTVSSMQPDNEPAHMLRISLQAKPGCCLTRSHLATPHPGRMSQTCHSSTAMHSHLTGAAPAQANSLMTAKLLGHTSISRSRHQAISSHQQRATSTHQPSMKSRQQQGTRSRTLGTKSSQRYMMKNLQEPSLGLQQATSLPAAAMAMDHKVRCSCCPS